MRLVYLGSGDIGLPTLAALLADPRHEVLAVVTQPDRPVGRHQETPRPAAVKTLALAHGRPVLQPERLRRDPAAVEALRAFGADVFVVFAYGQILPKTVLDPPRLGCLNVHASLLPRWRGAAPIQAAVAAGDRETGLTIMWMAEGLDTGDILLSGPPVAIGPDETTGALHDRLAGAAPGLLREALNLFENGRGTPPRTPQDPARATYAPKLDRASGRMDWTRGRLALERHLRAMDPWPGAWTTLPTPAGPRVLKATRGTATTEEDAAGDDPHPLPGTVLRADETRGLLVACGGDDESRGGGLWLKTVQLEGKRRMDAGDFLRGHPVAPGTVLG